MNPAAVTLIAVLVLALPTSYYWLFTRQRREPTGRQAVEFLVACLAVVAVIYGLISIDHVTRPH